LGFLSDRYAFRNPIVSSAVSLSPDSLLTQVLKRHSVKSILFILFSLSLAACSPGSEVCSTEVRSSVLISVTDHNGEPLTEGALVYYSVNDGPDELAEQLGTQNMWAAGEEQAGTFEIFAEYRLEEFTGCLWSDSTEPVQVEVTAGTCHVETQELELMLATNLSDCVDG